MMEPDLFLLPVFDRILFLSPLQGITALLNRSAARKIREAIVADPSQDRLHPEVQEIVRTIRTTPVSDPVSASECLQPAFLGLITTRSCQGACRYCGFQPEASADGNIDLGLCAQMIEWMGQTARDLDREILEVHLFGGEPSLAKEAVDFIVHKTRFVAAELYLRPHLEITTNGVMAEERIRWIGEHFNTVVLSLDGSQKAHDVHRPLRDGRGSWTYAHAAARRLSDSSADLCLRCCISNRNIDNLEETVLWMQKEFHPAVIDLETVATTVDSAGAGILAPDPYEFAAKYHRLQAALYRAGGEALYSTAPVQGTRATSCPVGRDAVIVAPDGVLSSCYLPAEHCQTQGQDCAIGCVGQGNIRISMPQAERLRGLIHRKQRCRRCFCRWSCAGGCHVNQTYPDCSLDYSPFCLQTRVITAANLLTRLGFDSWVERFLADTAEMEHMAEQASDRLEHTFL